eukprot:PhM_4_TR4946/c0_g1_i1/m.53554
MSTLSKQSLSHLSVDTSSQQEGGGGSPRSPSALSVVSSTASAYFFSDHGGGSDSDEDEELREEGSGLLQGQTKSSSWSKVRSATISLVSSTVGGGVLALSSALDQSSLYPGIALIILIGILCTVTCAMLVHVADETQHFTFPQMFHHCFPSRRLTWLVGMTIVLYTFGSCVVYIVVIRDSMGPLAVGWMGLTGFLGTGTAWVLFVAPVLFALSSLRKLTELSSTSVIAFLTIVYVAVIVLIRFAQTSMEERPQIKTVKFQTSFFSALSNISFAFLMHYNIPPLYKELGPRRTPYKMAVAVAS